MKKILFFIVLAFTQTITFAQKNEDVYYQKDKDFYHFYFDEQYYLVDKNCEFKYYTRVAKYNSTDKVFNGFFTDYYNNGKTALTGNYTNGKKDGVFKHYYDNGTLRSTTVYQDDKAIGEWEYFYYNGTPWLKLNYNDGGLFINSYWNNIGQQQVVNGKGTLVFEDFVWEYNESGVQSVIYTGRLKDGKPVGNWKVYYRYPQGYDDLILGEYFSKGKFEGGVNYSNYKSYKSSKVILRPRFTAINASLLISKDCSIDENKDYTIYLQNFLNAYVAFDNLNENDFGIKHYVKVKITEEGKGTDVDVSNISNNDFAKNLNFSLKAVPFWIPSFKEGKTVEDELSVEFMVNKTSTGGEIQKLKIIRDQEK